GYFPGTRGRKVLHHPTTRPRLSARPAYHFSRDHRHPEKPRLLLLQLHRQVAPAPPRVHLVQQRHTVDRIRQLDARPEPVLVPDRLDRLTLPPRPEPARSRPHPQ